MNYIQALEIIWAPGRYTEAEVLEAAATVLAALYAKSEEVHQASHLIVARRR